LDKPKTELYIIAATAARDAGKSNIINPNSPERVTVQLKTLPRYGWLIKYTTLSSSLTSSISYLSYYTVGELMLRIYHNL